MKPRNDEGKTRKKRTRKRRKKSVGEDKICVSE